MSQQAPVRVVVGPTPANRRSNTSKPSTNSNHRSTYTSERNPIVITVHPRPRRQALKATPTPGTPSAPRDRRVWTDIPSYYDDESYNGCYTASVDQHDSFASSSSRRGSSSSTCSSARNDSYHSYGSGPVVHSSSSNHSRRRQRYDDATSAVSFHHSSEAADVMVPMPLPSPPVSIDNESVSSGGSIDWAELVRKEREKEWTKRRRVRFALA